MATKQNSALAILVALLASACGSSPLAPSAPVTPPQHAHLLTVETFTLDPACKAAEDAARAAGQPTVTCATYAGEMANQGPGCAAHIEGTTTVYFDLTPTVVSINHWTVEGPVNPTGMVNYIGGPITVPSAGHLGFTTTATWTDVACR